MCKVLVIFLVVWMQIQSASGFTQKIVNTLSNARATMQKLTNNSLLTLSTPFSLARLYGLLSSLLAARNIL